MATSGLPSQMTRAAPPLPFVYNIGKFGWYQIVTESKLCEQ